MKTITIENLINGVATFNADAYCIEHEELAQEIMNEIDAHGAQIIEDSEERADALAKLDLPSDSDRVVYKAGDCIFSMEGDVKQHEIKEQLTKAKYYSVLETGSNDDTYKYVNADGETTMDAVYYSQEEAVALVAALTRKVLNGGYGEEAKEAYENNEWGWVINEWDFDEVREEIEDDTDEPMSIGAQIATLRDMYGWTQKQLADKSGLDRTYISRVESGAISVGMEVLNKIAAALGCEVRLVEK